MRGCFIDTIHPLSGPQCLGWTARAAAAPPTARSPPDLSDRLLEELRAELASAFLAAERGIPHQPDRHAAYVASWIKALKNDKNEIFRAASDAAKATDYLLALRRSGPRCATCS
jgi:antirestriction protein ArdC